jgi:hypothetical protein
LFFLPVNQSLEQIIDLQLIAEWKEGADQKFAVLGII